MYTISKWGKDFELKKSPKPCAICGKPTCWIEVFSREPICSEKCSMQQEKELQEYEEFYVFKITNFIHDI